MSFDSLFEKKVEDEVSEINLTPLIDIVFLLLIFFMVASQFEQSTKIEIEKVKSGNQTVDLSQDIKVYIDTHGNFFYLDQKYNLQDLVQKITLLIDQTLTKKVLIIPDKKGSIEPFVLLLGTLQTQGITAIGIGTEKDLSK